MLATGATKVIDSKGHWLNTAAADSYLRMVAASGNLTGLVSAGRTRAEQQRLYDGWNAGRPGFNLAAKPGTSLHESGRAIDVQTGSPLQRWMTKGSRYDKVTPTGTTRAADYGWLRTVPSEAWHFQYFATKDKHRNDKPATSTTPPAPAVAKLRLATFNCWDYGAPSLSSRKDALVKVVREADAGIYLLNECPEATRDVLRAGMDGGPTRWLVRPREGQAVMWDSTLYLEVGEPDRPVFRSTSLDFYGGVIVTLKDKATGQLLVVGSFHLPSNKVASIAAQKAHLATFAKLMRKRDGLRVMGGDGANGTDWVPGWPDVSLTAATSKNRTAHTFKKGDGSITDHLFTDSLTPIDWRGYNVRPSGSGSDHNLLIAAANLPTPIPTN